MPDAPPAPSRSERKACWGGRDRYFSCLDAANVTEAGTEPAGACKRELGEYETNCAKSWVSRPSSLVRLGRGWGDEGMRGDGRGWRCGPYGLVQASEQRQGPGRRADDDGGGQTERRPRGGASALVCTSLSRTKRQFDLPLGPCSRRSCVLREQTVDEVVDLPCTDWDRVSPEREETSSS